MPKTLSLQWLETRELENLPDSITVPRRSKASISKALADAVNAVLDSKEEWVGAVHQTHIYVHGALVPCYEIGVLERPRVSYRLSSWGRWLYLQVKENTDEGRCVQVHAGATTRPEHRRRRLEV